jgi:branched-chain amino acid transport system substrate-binding protein
MRSLCTESLLVLTSLLGVSLTSSYGAEASDIRIGLYLSLSGPGEDVTFASNARRGIELAVEEVNRKNGVVVAGSPRRVKVLTFDDQASPEVAHSVVSRLASDTSVTAILGGNRSAMALAGAYVCQKQKVPMISPSATDPRVNTVGNFIFRTCLTDSVQGNVMARFAQADLKARTAALIVDTSSGYSVSLAQGFATTFRSLGGRIVAEAKFDSADPTFGRHLDELKQKEPDVIFIPGMYFQAGSLARQLRDAGVNSTLLGGDGWDSPRLAEIGGEAVSGSYFCTHFTSSNPRVESTRFARAYERKYQGPPDGMAALGYDTARLLLAALSRARSTSHADLQASLAKTHGFTGATGSINLDAASSRSICLVTMQDGMQHLQKVVTP